MQTAQQLTLEIKPHPALEDRAQPVLFGSLKLKGPLIVGRDLNAGDQLVVLIQNADGEVLSQHLAAVDYAFPKPVRERGEILGYERVHIVNVA